ncbi:hypothetical protein KM043_014213 [Ampulex compressa]|nr:hypothetical protein KM043_014213 [Ampulex compressa]
MSLGCAVVINMREYVAVPELIYWPLLKEDGGVHKLPGCTSGPGSNFVFINPLGAALTNYGEGSLNKSTEYPGPGSFSDVGSEVELPGRVFCVVQLVEKIVSPGEWSRADLSCRNTKQGVNAIYTRTNFVTLKYVTDSWGTNANGFRLVITAVKDPKHTCKDFRCTQNEFCIETDLLCDGVNHCGDGSDEATSTLCANSEASTILGMQTTWFAVALVFVILSMAGLVTAAVLCFCRQRASTPRHPHNAHNAQTHPPVSFPLGTFGLLHFRLWINRRPSRASRPGEVPLSGADSPLIRGHPRPVLAGAIIRQG